MRNGTIWGRALVRVRSRGRRAGHRFIVGGFVVRVWDDHSGSEKRYEGLNKYRTLLGRSINKKVNQGEGEGSHAAATNDRI